LDIVKKRKQALLKHRRILYYSLGGCVVVAGVTGTVLGILLTKSKQNDDPPPSPLPPIVATKFTDLNVGDDLANKFLLMPQSG
jgi:hypothetical protein